jgi:hypothetical protein
MKLSSLILSAALTLLVVSLTRAQEVIVRAELDTNRALIGDQVKLHLSVEKPSTLQVGFPILKDTLSRDIEIISHSPVDTSSPAAGRNILHQDILISVFDTGLYEIPSLLFIVQPNDKADTLHTLPVYLEIIALRADSTIRDIKAIYNAPLSLAEIASYIKDNYLFGLMAIAMVLLTWFIVRYVRRKRGQGHMAETEMAVELPEVTALRELEKLKSEKPWLNNKVKFYHIRVSEVLRTYIERRFKIMALEQTTDEILVSLKSPVCKTEDLNHLSAMLKLSDLVKFAKVIPDAEENAALVGYAAAFIHNTSARESADLQHKENSSSMDQHNRIS